MQADTGFNTSPCQTPADIRSAAIFEQASPKSLTGPYSFNEESLVIHLFLTEDVRNFMQNKLLKVSHTGNM